MPKADWREKITAKRETLITRLIVLSADEDSKIALDAIKLLLDLSGDMKAEPVEDKTPLFAIEANTHPDVLPKKPRKDLH